jgi:hypothetical protein
MDGHGFHATTEWMTFCFFNNIYCCYFPSHCSHEMQPLDNGPFNAVKAAYRKKLEQFNFNNDSHPVDKINFIKAYGKARVAGLTEKNIQTAFETTGNWPISRRKALSHPEIQHNDGNKTPETQLDLKIEHDSEVASKTSCQVRNYGKNKSPIIRRHYDVIAKYYARLEFELTIKNDRIAALEAEVARLTETQKRRAIPNPNQRFMRVSEALASGQHAPENWNNLQDPGVEEEGIEVVENDENEDEEDEEDEDPELLVRRTRSGRAVERPRNL